MNDTSPTDVLPERVLALHAPLYDLDTAGQVSPPDARAWQQVVEAVQRTVPGAAPLRPGWCVMRARGPTRYYGGEFQAARAVLECIPNTPTPEIPSLRSRVGVASGAFAARQAAIECARLQSPDDSAEHVHIIDAHDTAAFLARLPVSRIEDEQLTIVLMSLGIRTLGDLAALPESSVLQRFGRAGALAHRKARGLGGPGAPEVPVARPQSSLTRTIEFEPPLGAADQLAFACVSYADEFVSHLAAQGLVCTELHLSMRDDLGAQHERSWSHPHTFTATDIVNRIRWQGAELPQATERGGAGITQVQLSPLRTAKAADHEPGLFTEAPSDRVHHQLTRAQSLLSHEHVGTPLLLGGRISRDRQALLPWGAAPESLHSTGSNRRQSGGAWPGMLTGATPTIVFRDPPPVMLLSVTQQPITVTEDDLLSASPKYLATRPRESLTVSAWSSVWPIRERWWGDNSLTLFRLQLLLESGDAWLLQFAHGSGWQAEGRYN